MRPEEGELDGVTEDGGQDEDVVDEEPGGEGGDSLGQLHSTRSSISILREGKHEVIYKF